MSISDLGDQVRKLAALAEELDLAELDVAEGDLQIRLVRAGVPSACAPASAPAGAQPASAAAQPGPATAGAAASAGFTLKAPLTGTFFRAAAPGQRPFVSPGQQVAVGDVLCIIESMKMMNHIEAEQAGTVSAVLVEDGSPVDAGCPLITLD